MSNVLQFEPTLPAGHLATAVYQSIDDAGEEARRERYMAIIRGKAGIGKSYALSQLARGYEDCTAIVTLNPETGARTHGAGALRRAFDRLETELPFNVVLHEKYRPGRILEGLRLYCQLARERHSIPILLVIDEFQHAAPGLMDFVRAVWDPQDGGLVGLCGLVLCGNQRLFNPSSGKMQEIDYAPLIRRARHVLDFPSLPPGDIDAVLAHHRIAGAESKRLLSACGEAGGIGEMFNVIQKAQQLSGTPIVAFKHLQAAARTTGLSGATWRRQKK